MKEAPPFTREAIALLESLVGELLARELTPSDLPVLRWVVARQQVLLEQAYVVVGQMCQELETLRRPW